MSNVTVVPWGLHPLSPWIIDELKRRSKEYGQNPNPTETSPYSGPRTAWARFFSNGTSKLPAAKGKDGFVLGGTYGFAESYGFNENGKITIGVDAKGNPHQIDRENYIASRVGRSGETTRTDFPYRPPPNVESVSCELNGSNSSFPNLCRKITINWKCYSLAQLNYLIPYFLTPRMTCLVEWGWNYYDRTALVDLSDLDWINNMFVDPGYTLEYIQQSNGNYDAGLGFIVDFGYKMNENGGYDCHTTLINANKLLEGEQIATKDVTIKQEGTYVSVKSFYSFAKENMINIDSDKPSYTNIRRELQLGEEKEIIDQRVFRITKVPSQNKKNKLWLRMDLIQDIINAFFRVSMVGNQTAVIRELDIMDTRMCGHPLLKSANTNVLVPNRYAPRFAYEEVGDTNKEYIPENDTYNRLFKQTVENTLKEYSLDYTNYDNLQEVINPSGESFPVYEDDQIFDNNGNVAQKFNSGYWGFLRDLFIDEEMFKSLVLKHDSILKMMEELLQKINEALCQTCQLKLIPAEYGNSKYSVYDENLPGIATTNDAKTLPVITLGAIDSAFIKAASFDVKMSSEMMNQLVMQSANPEQDPNGSTQTKNVSANPIVSRYSAGDRLYDKGEITTVVVSANNPNVGAQQTNAQTTTNPRVALANQRAAERAAAEARKKEQEANTKKYEENVKKRQTRSDKNLDTFFIYYEKDPNNPGRISRYFLCEKNTTFLNYALKRPDKNAAYLNNGIMPGTTLTLELLGISGINYLSQFLIDHAPEPYNFENAVWQISDVKQNIEDKNWTTTVVAQVRPLTTL